MALRNILAPDLVKRAIASHSLLGLFFGALIFQICLTGTLSMFAPELKRWEQPDAPLVRSVSPEIYAKALTDGVARSEEPGGTVILLGPTADLPRFELRLPGREGGGMVAGNGAVSAKANTPWTNFVTEVHESLHLPAPWGSLLVGLSGVFLLTLIITGLLSHPRIFKDAFHVRLGGSPRLQEADIHNRLSVWALPFHTTLALTGAALALIGLIGAPIALVANGGNMEAAMVAELGPQTAPDKRPAPLPDIAALIRKIEAENPPAKVSFLLVQQAGTRGQTITIDTDAPGHLASGESYLFDTNGKRLWRAGFSDGSAGKQIRAALVPLHYGSFGGLPLRVAYALLGAGLCWITATGLNIWFIRRRQRGAAAPSWERLWTAFVWGQPAALAIASLGSAALVWSPAAAYVGATLLTLGAAAIRKERNAIRRDLWIGTVVLITAIVGYQASQH